MRKYKKHNFNTIDWALFWFCFPLRCLFVHSSSKILRLLGVISPILILPWTILSFLVIQAALLVSMLVYGVICWYDYSFNWFKEI